MSNQSGQLVLERIMDEPIYPWPEDEQKIPRHAQFAWAEAGGDYVKYQLIRAHFDLSRMFVREEISVEKFEVDWDIVKDAIERYDKFRKQTPKTR